MQIDWLKDFQASSFEVLFSDNGRNWEKVYYVSNNISASSYIILTEAETRFLRLNLLKSNSEENFGISEIIFLDIKNSLTQNDFLIYAAKNSQKGNYPRYLLEEASYWTVVGVNNDVKEALINEDGMVEVEKASFSIEPMLKIDEVIYLIGVMLHQHNRLKIIICQFQK